MNLVKLAVILLPTSSGPYPSLLRKDISGIKMLERLILTLQRAGLDEVAILSQGSMGDIREKTEEDMAKDSRFQGKIIWHERAEEDDLKFWQHIQSLIGSRNFLLVNGNMVTTATTIQDFIEQSISEGILGHDAIACLKGLEITSGNIFLFPPSKLESLKDYIENHHIEKAVNAISLDGPKHFAELVEDERSALQAERKFIELHKHYYRQFMDFWVNSFFSLKISSLLVRTSITPNALTLLGLIIGLFSAWQFAQGNYWGGVFGGLAFVGTAIWDCCDGDVARLKFMESDFGETLDTTCDNLNNIFAFTGIMIGVALTSGFLHALIPFILLGAGGGLIFYFIYYPKGEKGSFFQGTWIYDVIQHLASRDFVYIALLFGILGRLDWFLWLSGLGSIVFALALYLAKRKLIR